MFLRLPDRLNGDDRAQCQSENILGELARERVATANRMSERVVAHLAALRACTDAAQRPRLIDRAANALWELVVQHECAGLDADLSQLTSTYDIPQEVLARLGPHPESSSANR
jgi:hypothetical protein